MFFLLFSIFCLLNSQASGTVSKRLSFLSLSTSADELNSEWKVKDKDLLSVTCVLIKCLK